jgi:hypothetical protein
MQQKMQNPTAKALAIRLRCPDYTTQGQQRKRGGFGDIGDPSSEYHASPGERISYGKHPNRPPSS